MTLHTLAHTTRTGARKLRLSHLIAVLGGAALAVTASAAVGHLTPAMQHRAARVVAVQPQQGASLVQPQGGQAETIADARRTVIPAHGGIAEGISAAHTSDAVVTLPSHGGLAETLAAAQALTAVVVAPVALGAVPARGGRAEALDAKRATEIAAAAPALHSADAALAMRAKGGLAEALDAVRTTP